MFEIQKFLANKDELCDWVKSDITETQTTWYANPYSLALAEQGELPVIAGDRFVADGNVTAGMLSSIVGRRCESLHFDYSGCAGEVFETVESMELTLGIIGGSQEDVDNFKQQVLSRYPGLDISFLRDGFYSEHVIEGILSEIEEARPDVVIVSMGSPRQEKFCAALKKRNGKPKKLITCGAFVSQVAERGVEYYPKIIREFNIRWVYRIYRDRRILTRVLRYYLPFIFRWKLLRQAPSLVRKIS